MDLITDTGYTGYRIFYYIKYQIYRIPDIWYPNKCQKYRIYWISDTGYPVFFSDNTGYWIFFEDLVDPMSIKNIRYPVLSGIIFQHPDRIWISAIRYYPVFRISGRPLDFVTPGIWAKGRQMAKILAICGQRSLII